MCFGIIRVVRQNDPFPFHEVCVIHTTDDPSPNQSVAIPDAVALWDML